MNNDEYYLYKILSGKTRIKVENRTIEVLPPSYNALCEAADIYKKTYNSGYLYGALSRSEMLDYMINRGLWSIEKNMELEKLPEYIHNAKADLYDAYTSFQNLEPKRKVISILEKRYDELWREKQTFDRFTIDGIAFFHKTSFLICAGAGLNYQNSDININKLYLGFMGESLEDALIRRIAKFYEWKQYWRAVKLGQKIFGDILTREQHALISWSQFYDNVADSSESPLDEVIEDDDLMDGWCVIQKRKRKEENKRKIADKYGDAGEIFIPVSSVEQAAKVNELNEGNVRMVRRQRELLVQKQEHVREQDMPDSKVTMRQQAMEEFKNRAKR